MQHGYQEGNNWLGKMPHRATPWEEIEVYEVRNRWTGIIRETQHKTPSRYVDLKLLYTKSHFSATSNLGEMAGLPRQKSCQHKHYKILPTNTINFITSCRFL